MNKTPIENLMNLDDIFQQPMQSMEGYPRPPHVNSNFNEQMMSEINERQGQTRTLQNKIRNNTDFRKALNGGVEIQEEYQFGPRITQPPAVVEPYQQEAYAYEPYQPDHQLSCINVARHIKYCPICSKFYENDKSPYVICIIILVIICIILLKKVIEGK